MVGGQFPARVPHVQPRAPVSAGVTSAATKALEGQTQYLRNVINAIHEGRADIWRNQTVAPDVLDGQPVYWNADAQRYEQAFAGVESDSAIDSLVPLASSDVVGMAINKVSGNRADIVLSGAVPFVTLANAIDGAATPGRYYLSASSPGKMQRQRPGVTVAVCIVLGPLDACDENTWVIVAPQMRDFLEDHIHFQVELTAAPAGCYTPPAEGEAPVITDPDPTKRGWLPADHASFDDHAPANAAFGYNIAAHPSLLRVWPPIPATAALLEEFNPTAGDRVAGRVPSARIRFDNFGIWWMDPCTVPWPFDDATCLSSSSSSSASVSSSSSSSGTVACLAPGMELLLSFIKMTFTTQRTAVTSLQPDTDQPFEFVNCDGVIANTGDLFARLILALLIDDQDALGGQVLKNIENNRFKRGWAVEGIVAGSTNIELTSTRQRRLVPGDNTTPLVHQGIVVADVPGDPIDREITPTIVYLGDALERVYKNIPYLELPVGRTTELRLRFEVPAAGLPASPRFTLRLTMFGQLAGTMTDLEVSYYRLAQPDPTTVIDEGDTAMTFATGVVVAADSAVLKESEAIEIAAGDTLYVSVIRRLTGTPSYNAGIGLLRIRGIVSAET